MFDISDDRLTYPERPWTSLKKSRKSKFSTNFSTSMIVYDDRLWLSSMIIVYDHRLSSSSIIIVHHHRPSSSSIIIVHHHRLSSSSIIIVYHHRLSSSSIIIVDHRRPSSFKKVFPIQKLCSNVFVLNLFQTRRFFNTKVVFQRTCLNFFSAKCVLNTQK